MNPILKNIEDKYINKSLSDMNFRKLPKIDIGMTVKVNYRIIEGDKERIQPFVGVVIAQHRGISNANATFTVRRVNQGYGVERVFPLHSPKIDSIDIMKETIVRRAKLYYLRNLFGKKARLKEKIYKKS